MRRAPLSPDSPATLGGLGGQTADEALAVRFVLNGEAIEARVDPAERLLDHLRYRLGLPGTKEGCGEGECGACTVWMDGVPVNSCLVFAWQAEGTEVRTVESAVAADVAELLATGATQCGACTPGVVMTALWLVRHPEFLRERTVRELMAGNLCRCTGYDGIIEGVEKALAARGLEP
jgi:aerobic-type carbon monoxide dehydrogenase small subunit (CoxS/CutS family)